TAVRLAIELDAAESVAALTEIVVHHGDDYADACYEYAAAAYALIRLAGAPGVRSVLDSLVVSPAGSGGGRRARGSGRLRQTEAVAAIAAIGGAAAVSVVADFGDQHVELRVSAAFALAKLGGAAARAKIEAWLADPASSVIERMFDNGLGHLDVTRAELYRR